MEDILLNRFNLPIALDKTIILFGKFNTFNMYRVENLLILVIKHHIFTCKSNSTDALLRLISGKIHVEKYLLLRMVNMPNMKKKTGENV